MQTDTHNEIEALNALQTMELGTGTLWHMFESSLDEAEASNGEERARHLKRAKEIRKRLSNVPPSIAYTKPLSESDFDAELDRLMQAEALTVSDLYRQILVVGELIGEEYCDPLDTLMERAKMQADRVGALPA